MSEQAPGPGGKMDLPQGDLGLLDSDLARRLLASTVPARSAFVWTDGTPRVLPTWFHWTGAELVMPTFLSAPHVRKAAARVEALRANPAVAVTIDTEEFPPEGAAAAGPGLGGRGGRGAGGVCPGRPPLPGPDRPARHQDGPHRRAPTWAGVIDFKTRLPTGMGGVTGREGSGG
jgi:hypothetical protein